MTSQSKVALITGGASGIGLAVAEALAARDWTVILVDRDTERGREAANKLSKATFHPADVADYASLAKAFEAVFESAGQLDSVFANAGIAMTAPSVPATAGSGPPPAPDTTMIDINLIGLIYTTQLALPYLAKSTVSGGDLIITASSAGFYASAVSPAYNASKHGAVEWARSIAPTAMRDHGVRGNAICPGIARTNILPEAVFQMFPDALLTPVSKVVEVVLLMFDSGEDGIEGHPRTGQTVEICGPNHYFREQIQYCDGTMRVLMGAGAPSEK